MGRPGKHSNPFMTIPSLSRTQLSRKVAVLLKGFVDFAAPLSEPFEDFDFDRDLALSFDLELDRLDFESAIAVFKRCGLSPELVPGPHDFLAQCFEK